MGHACCILFNYIRERSPALEYQDMMFIFGPFTEKSIQENFCPAYFEAIDYVKYADNALLGRGLINSHQTLSLRFWSILRQKLIPQLKVGFSFLYVQQVNDLPRHFLR